MSGFIEPTPDVVLPQPGGIDDPLGESVLDLDQPWCRIFEPRDIRLVIGRHQNAVRECRVAEAQADGVPVNRRVAGGGAVVLAPGMVVVALRLAATRVGTSCYFDMVNRALVPAVAACGVTVACRGFGDLTVVEADGITRKVLGASLRQTSRMVVYLGVFLVEDAVPLMERYLHAPSREPDYRAGRGHRAFCTHLGAHGVATSGLITAIRTSCDDLLGSEALR